MNSVQYIDAATGEILPAPRTYQPVHAATSRHTRIELDGLRKRPTARRRASHKPSEGWQVFEHIVTGLALVIVLMAVLQ